MTSTPTPAFTPGYGIRLEIWFQSTRRGQRTAWHFSRDTCGAVRLPLDEAELLIATGKADQVDGHPFPPLNLRRGR